MLGFSPLAATPLADEGAVDPNAEVNLVGVQGTSVVGTPVVVGSAEFAVPSVSAEMVAGSVSVSEGTGATVFPAGQTVAAAVGGPQVTGDAVFEVSALFAALEVGAAAGAAGAGAVVQGPDAAAAQVQPVAVTGGAGATVDGFSVVAETGQVFLWSIVSPDISSNWTDVFS